MKKIILASVALIAMSGCNYGSYYDEETTCTSSYDGSSVTCKTRYRNSVELECKDFEDNSHDCVSYNSADEVAEALDGEDVVIDVADDMVIAESPDSYYVVELK